MQRYSKLPTMPRIRRSTGVRDVPVARSHRRVHNARRRLGAEVVARVVADYEAGCPTTALMERYQIGKGTVLGILHGAGVKMRCQGARNIDLVEATQLYEAGWSLKRLAERYDCDHESVRRALKEAGVAIRPRNGWGQLRVGRPSPTH